MVDVERMQRRGCLGDGCRENAMLGMLVKTGNLKCVESVLTLTRFVPAGAGIFQRSEGNINTVGCLASVRYSLLQTANDNAPGQKKVWDMRNSGEQGLGLT